MNKKTRISALVSRTTKALLQRHVRVAGVKKGHLVEQALRHHLQALQELPADVIVHSRLVVTRKSGAAMLKRMEPGKPTDGLTAVTRNAGHFEPPGVSLINPFSRWPVIDVALEAVQVQNILARHAP